MLTDPVWFIHQILGLEVGIYLIGRHDFQLQMLEIFHLAFPLIIHSELNQNIPLTTPSSSRGDEWSIKIFNCSQNFTFARFARKNLHECSLAPVPQIFGVARKLAKQIFYFWSCSQKNRSARHARDCSQRPFVTPSSYLKRQYLKPQIKQAHLSIKPPPAPHQRCLK